MVTFFSLPSDLALMFQYSLCRVVLMVSFPQITGRSWDLRFSTRSVESF